MSVRRKVQVWIFSGSEVLLLRTNAKRGSFWQPVTGSVEQGESYADGALREAQEETGLAFTAPPLEVGEPFEFPDRFGAPGSVCRECIFRLDASPAAGKSLTVTLDPREHEEYGWLTPAEAETKLKFDGNRAGLKAALAVTFRRKG